MNILHINSYLVDRFFYNNLYEEQIANNHNVSVYVSIAKGGSKEASALGSHIVVKEDFYNLEKIFFFVKQNKIIQALEKQFDINKYDIIHAHSLFTNGYVAMRLAHKYQKPYVVAVRNGDVNIFFKKMIFLRRVGRKILENASAIIFLSNTYKNLVIDRYVASTWQHITEEKSYIIPNGVDDFWIKNINLPKSLEIKSIINAIYVGEITDNKNIVKSAKALSLMAQEGYQITFTIIGKIKEKKVFAALSKYPFIVYKGQMKKELLINEYRKNDIFLMPSKTEAFGLVYAEAISQGLPVIYTKNQGFDGQFEDGIVGYSVDCFDAEDIMKKIKMIIERYDEISRNCIDRADNFSWKKYTCQYEKIYEEINYNC